MSVDGPSVLRRFNRTYTQRIGVLSESFLGSGRPLGPSRLLFEIGADGRQRWCASCGTARPRLRLPEPVAARARAGRPGHGVARPRTTTAGGHAYPTRPTPGAGSTSGRTNSPGLVEPLTDGQRAGSPRRCDRRPAGPGRDGDFDARRPRLGRARRAGGVLRRARRALPSASTRRRREQRRVRRWRPPDGVFVVAAQRRRARRMRGCAARRRPHGGDQADVDPSRLARRRPRRAAAAPPRVDRAERGHAVVRRHQQGLSEAISMYQRAGYHAIERYNDNPYAHHWFAKDL